jgi:4-hydroxy-4-methyl-2-oxoglutarate aldolase
VVKLTPEQIEALRSIDSPTISNAIEWFRVRPRVCGFASYDLRCVFPELGVMLGYAVTCTADSTTEGRCEPDGVMRLWEALEAAPKPAVLVIKDIGPEPRRSCHMGEIMVTTAKALGAVGSVCDGGLRDILEVKALGGFQYFCPGFVVSHGNPVICEVNVPVTVCGLSVASGDLLHGDINGLLAIPHELAAIVVERAMQVRREEQEILNFVRQPGLTVARLREFRDRYKH